MDGWMAQDCWMDGFVGRLNLLDGWMDCWMACCDWLTCLSD